MNIIDFYDRVSRQADALVQSIPDDRFGFATPCSEWDVKALCNHIYTGDIVISTRIRDEPLPDPKSTADRLGDDPKGRMTAAFADLRGQLAEPGVLERSVTTSRDGIDYQRDLAGLVERRIADLVVHNWDLAKALGHPTDDFDPELVEWTFAHFQARFEHFERTAPQIFASVKDVKSAPAGATDADRLAAFMGREVDFTPGPFTRPAE